MSALNNKSEFNIEAAKVLIDNDLFAPSIHCSYYAVFQKLKYFYVKEKKLSYQVLSQKIRIDQRNSHKFIIEEFCALYLVKCKDIYNKRLFFNKIKDLKALREESDYEDVQINFDKSNKALIKSEDIIQSIKQYF